MEDGSYGNPVNLGEKINTQLNEETPTLSPDGKRIYFSSQGHSSMGGFDVFYSELQADGTWGEAVNIGYPLNTTDDDFTNSPTGFREDGIAYIFANSEPDQHPIFKFEIIDPEAVAVEVTFEEATVEEVAEVTAQIAGLAQPQHGSLRENPLLGLLVAAVAGVCDLLGGRRFGRHACSSLRSRDKC